MDSKQGRPRFANTLSASIALITACTAADGLADDGVLGLGEFSFDPPYVTADNKAHAVKVTLGPLPTSSSSARLDLEELTISGGLERVRRVGELNADGRGGFQGEATFNNPVCGVRRLRVTDPATGQVSATLELPSARAYFPTAVFDVIQNIEIPDSYEIGVEDSGPGLLIVTVNSALRNGDSNDAKVTVSLNGKREFRVRPGTDCAEHFIELKEDSRRLRIKARGTPGERVSVRIDAVANFLELRTLERPSAAAGRPLRAQVYVAAPVPDFLPFWFVPVPNARVQLSLESQGNVAKQIRSTDVEGAAEVAFAAELVGDSAVLTAELLNTAELPRTAVDPIEFVVDGFEGNAAQATVWPEEVGMVSIGQPDRNLTLEVGETATVDLTVRVEAEEGEAFKVRVKPEVFPSGGLRVKQPVKELKGVGPTTFIVSQELTANEALIDPTSRELYQVYTDVIPRGKRKQMVSTLLEVDVTEPNVGGRLHVYPPVSDPAILREGDLGGQVTFKAIVTGTSKPPSHLVLRKLIEESGDLEEIGRLLDDGNNGDRIADDLVYTGRFVVSGTPETRNLYSADAPSGEHSDFYSLEIVPDTDFPLALEPPSEFADIVDEPGTGDRFVADQVLARFRQHVAPVRILEIIGALGSTSLLGFEPVFDVAQVEFSGDSTPAAVRSVQAALESFDEVEFVSPNRELLLAQAANEGPDQAVYPDQQLLDHVRAREAWLGAGATPPAVDWPNVAILDSTVDHPALNGLRVAQHEDCTGGPGTSAHGTWVAGIAASVLGGAATGPFLFPVSISKDRVSLFSAMVCGLGHMAKHPAVARIANISAGFNANLSDTRKEQLEKAVFEAVRAERGILVVAAAGNAELPQLVNKEFYPAAFQNPGLIAVANTTLNDQPHSAVGEATRRGPWVDLAAHGVNVLTLSRGGGTIRTTGTSLSAPAVAGAASILWSHNISAGPRQIARMLMATTRPLATVDEIGAGRLDMAESIVNGSIELGPGKADTPATWRSNASVCRSPKPPVVPGGFFQARDGRRFLRCRGSGDIGRAEKRIQVPAGAGGLQLSALIAAFANPPSRRLDFELRLQLPDGTIRSLWTGASRMRRNRCGGLAGKVCRDWRPMGATLADPPAGPYTVVFEVRDRGDERNGSLNLLLDAFRAAARPSEAGN